MFGAIKAFFLFLICFNTALFADKNVLVLHSYHHGLQWTDNISKGIIDTFDKADEKINIYFEYLDSKRHLEASFMETTFHYFLLKHYSTAFDAIIVSDNDALFFINKYQHELFPDKPVIFCGVNNFTPELVSNIPQVTGVKEMIDYDGTLSIAMKLFPKRKKVMVVLDDTLTASKILAEVKMREKYLNDKLEFYYFWDFEDDMLASFIKENQHDLLVYALAFNRDKSGNFFGYDDSIDIIKKHFGNDVPIFGSWDFFLGKGIVGGVIISGHTQGKIAAELALKVLQWEEANSLAIQSNIGKDGIIFDYMQMQKFSLKEPRTPLPISYINKPIDFYTLHKNVLIPVSIFLVILLILFILRELRNRDRNKIIEKINASLEHKIELAVQESEKNEKIFRFIANSAPYVIWIVDTTFKLTYINDKVNEYFSSIPDELIGKENFPFLGEECFEELLKHIERLKQDLTLDSVQFDFYCDVSQKHFKNYVMPIHSNEGDVVGFKGIIQDVTEEKMSFSTLEEAAQTDALTGLLNRSTLELRFLNLLRDIRAEKKELCLMMIDIDHFKKINDNLGHLTGDHVLVKIAELLRFYFRKSDLIFRYGGEEFIVLLPDISSQNAIVSAQKIRKLVEQEDFSQDDKKLLITISIGLSMLDQNDTEINSIIIRADNALYEAKKKGRNKVEVF